MNSFTEPTGDVGCTTSMLGYIARKLTGAKLSSLNASLGCTVSCSENGWLMNKGAGWWDGNYLNTLYNHYLTPNARRPDCILFHNPGWKAPRSQHPGGVNLLFCDGHLVFIKDSIHPRTWLAASTRAGGEVLSADAF